MLTKESKVLIKNVWESKKYGVTRLICVVRQVHGRVVVKFGQNPGESIVDLAREERAAMVVLGTRGLGTIRRTILGSVSDYVLHHVHCPVAVCSHQHPHVSPPSSPSATA